MPDDYTDVIAAGLGTPRGKSHPNKIAFQPDNADWSLDRLGEIDEIYRKEFGKSLPLSNKGQGSVHNKLGFDHRPNADISVDPSSREGQRLMAVMRERNIPFLAFNGPVPGASTGKHIHAGRPSHRSTAKYNVGSQVKFAKQQPKSTGEYDDVISAALTDDYSDVVAAAKPAPRKKTLAEIATGGASAAPQSPSTHTVPNIRDILTEATNAAPVRSSPKPTSNMGELRTLEEPTLRATEAVQTEQAAGARAMRTAPMSAQARLHDPKRDVPAEIVRRATAESDATAWRTANEPAIAAQTQAFRNDIQAARTAGGDANKWLAEMGTRAAGGVLEFLAGMPGSQAADDKLRIASEAAARAAEAEGADRNRVSKFTQEITAGLISTAPELAMMAAGLPPVGAFGVGGGVRSAGRGEDIPAGTLHGGATGAAFMFPGVGRGLAKVASHAGVVAAGTTAVELAAGATPYEALRTGATNALIAGGPGAIRSISRFTTAAERALKTPEPTVSPDLQGRLTARDIADAGGEVLSTGTKPRFRVSDEQLRSMTEEATNVPAPAAVPRTETARAVPETTPLSPSPEVAPFNYEQWLKTPLNMERRAAEFAGMDRETGPRTEVYSDERRAALTAQLSEQAPPVVLRERPTESSVREGAKPIFLSLKGGSSIEDLLGGKVERFEQAPQGSFRLEVDPADPNTGWAYPNNQKGWYYRPDALRPVFPDITESKFRDPNTRARVERADTGEWRLSVAAQPKPTEPIPRRSLADVMRARKSEAGSVPFSDIVDDFAGGVEKVRERLPDRELSAPHHAVLQPRTPDGHFDGPPATGREADLAADRALVRTAAKEYTRDYSALDKHPARRQGLDIANDDIAANYFSQLRRFATTHKPEALSTVDQAERLFSQGKYAEATRLADSALGGTHEFLAAATEADSAMGLVELGEIPASTRWRQAFVKIRENMARTGGLSGGGSSTYDVNKYPEGGRADHEKLALWLEPVIEELRVELQRVKSSDRLQHVRTRITEMLEDPLFADWHPLNKSAVYGVVAGKLREGEPAQATEAPRQKERSLPKTLERSGRDPGTNLTYEEAPNKATIARVEKRLTTEGPEAVEAWYRDAPPSADRTEAHRQLVDHYQTEAVKLADSDLTAAAAMREHAIEISNTEVARSTPMGQAIQAYSLLEKYTPAGVTKEVVKLANRGVTVPATEVDALVRDAIEHQRADKEVQKAHSRVAVLEAEAPPPTASKPSGAGPTKSVGTEGGASPSTRAPRKPRGESLLPTKLDQAREARDKAIKRRSTAKLSIAKRLARLEQSRTVAGYYRRSMNITRALMVSALSTAMRNLQSQLGRYQVERLTDIVEHGMRRMVGMDSDFSTRDIWRNSLRAFKSSEGETRGILGEHPAELTRMFNVYAGGVEVPIPNKAARGVERVFGTLERGAEIANFANRLQEFHLRSAEFLAELDLHLKKEKGMSLEQYTKRHGIDQIPKELIELAVDKSLEVTFAASPGRDGAGGRLLGSLIEVGNYIPPTISPAAFPRFLFNNLKFLYQYNPTGLIDLARKNQNRPRVISRALVGTSMLLLGYQFRNSDHAGEKWYELKIGGHTLDARPFGPFSTYLFLGEAIRRATNGEKPFSSREIAEAIGVSSGPGGSAIAIADKLYTYLADGNWEKAQRILKTEAGDFGRALLTPVRQVKDLIAAFDAEEGFTRDTSAAPFTGALQESVPFASRGLPTANRPTSTTPIHQEYPAVKALTGWRVQTPKTFLESQLDELHFDSSEVRSNTGNPRVDSIEKRLMGPTMDRLGEQLSRDEEFKKASKATRAVLLKEMLEDVRQEVRETGEGEDPDAYEELKEQRKPARQKEFEKEQSNSPGLSRALQLGVPVPVPRKHTDEDDLAYRARLIQTSRKQKAALDAVVARNAFHAASQTTQRKELHAAVS